MKFLGVVVLLCCWVMPAYASNLETETKALMQKYQASASYHARLSLRFAEFSLHEYKEGDWLDAWHFLRLARAHDQQVEGTN